MPAEDEDDEIDPKELETAILVFAHYLGINLDSEQHLIHIAEEAFHNLPPGWEFGIGENEHAGIPYFFNNQTGQSEWKHPEEQKYMRIVEAERKQKPKKNNNGRGGQQERGRQDDRDRERDRERDRDREKSRVMEVTTIEDFEASPEHDRRNTGTRGAAATSSSTGANNAQQTAASKPAKPSFGMSEDDFLDGGGGAGDQRARNRSSNASDQRSTSPSFFRDPKLTDSPRDHNSRANRVDGLAKWGSNYSSGNNNNTSASSAVDLSMTRASEALSSPQPSNRIIRRADGSTDVERRPSPNNTTRMGTSNPAASHDRFGGSNASLAGGSQVGRASAAGSLNVQMEDFPTREQNTSRPVSAGRSDERRDISAGRARDRDRDRDRSPRNRDRPDSRSGRERDRDWGNRDRSENDRSRAGSPSPSHRRRAETDVEMDLLQRDLDRLRRELEDVKMERKELQDQLSSLKVAHHNELVLLKEEIKAQEDKLHEERRARKQVEDQLSFAQNQTSNKIRESADLHEVKLREHARKLREEVEEEMKEKLRSLERRAADEKDQQSLELSSLRRKNDELARENDNLKRKINLSKEDGKAEMHIELNALRQQMRELEDEDRKKATELRNLREENAAVQGKLAMTLQAMQISTIESENAKTQRQQSMHEVEVQMQAFLQAQQRVQRLEQELAQTKAEAMVLKHEKDTLEAQLKKLQCTATVSSDQLSVTEAESRRLKVQAQQDIARLTSRVTELDAMVHVLRDQLDKAADAEQQSVRKVQSTVDQLETENRRLKERLGSATVKEEEMLARMRNLEKEIFSLQESIFRKDKAIKEEQRSHEVVRDQLAVLRNDYDRQLNETMEALQKEVAQREALTRTHDEETKKLQLEVSTKVPQIVSAALEKAEAQWQHTTDLRAKEVQHQYELQLSRLRQEVHDVQTFFAEKESRAKLAYADDRVELDKLRAHCKTIGREKEDLEDQILQLRRQLRTMEMNLASQSATQASSSSSGPRKGPPLAQAAMSGSLVPAGDGLFAGLLQRSYDAQPATEHEAVAQSASLEQQIERDALQYLTSQLSQLKEQVNASLQSTTTNASTFRSASMSSAAKHVSFPPEPLNAPRWTRFQPAVADSDPAPGLTSSSSSTVAAATTAGAAPSSASAASAAAIATATTRQAAMVSEMIQEELSQLPRDPLWQRPGLSNADMSTADYLLDPSLSLNASVDSSAMLPETERKERQEWSRGSFLAPPRPPASATSSSRYYMEYAPSSVPRASSRTRGDTSLNSIGSNQSFLGSSGVALSSSFNDFEVISDGGYYEGYWKAKYQQRSLR